MPDADVLLVGGGVASANCARTLREEGFTGSIVLAGRELDAPYNRPPCSKGHLQGSESREDTLFRPDAWYAEHDVDLRIRANVMKLDPTERTAKVGKETLSWGQALVATGANVRRLRVDGSELDGIHYLRTLGNSDTLRADLEDAQYVVVVGGSYIATEVAASCRVLGKEVAMIMQEQVVHERGFGTDAGRFFQGVLEEHGVVVHGGEELARFEGDGGPRVDRVVCESGLSVDADVVVLGVGAVPDVMLAKGAGLELGASGGVRCDRYLRTSADGVFAAGDMCEWQSVVHDRALRVEHWDVALQHGRTVALNMLGRDQPHEVVPYFFSDLADWASLEYVGPAASWDTEVVRGAYADGAFATFYLDGGRVAACLAVGLDGVIDEAKRLIAARTDLSGRESELASADLSTLR